MAKQRRGFAAMDKGRQREIAAKGGKAAHQKGTAHEWDSEGARKAGKIGGAVSRGGRGRVQGVIEVGTGEGEPGNLGEM